MLYITFYLKNVINNTTINKLYKIVFKTKQRNYKFFRWIFLKDLFLLFCSKNRTSNKIRKTWFLTKFISHSFPFIFPIENSFFPNQKKLSSFLLIWIFQNLLNSSFSFLLPSNVLHSQIRIFLRWPSQKLLVRIVFGIFGENPLNFYVILLKVL